jgi:hypothetical protein
MPPAVSSLEKLLAENAELKQRNHDLETALGLHDDHLGVIFKLPKSLTQLLGLLVAVPNVTPDMIQQRLMIATDAKVAMHRLRQAMEPFYTELGVTPTAGLIQSRRGLGYWIDSSVKDRIKSMVTPGVTPDDEQQFIEALEGATDETQPSCAPATVMKDAA